MNTMVQRPGVNAQNSPLAQGGIPKILVECMKNRSFLFSLLATSANRGAHTRAVELSPLPHFPQGL